MTGAIHQLASLGAARLQLHLRKKTRSTSQRLRDSLASCELPGCELSYKIFYLCPMYPLIEDL